MARPKGINQVSIHLKLDRENYKRIENIKKFTGSRNRTINRLIKRALDMDFPVYSEIHI